MRKSALSAATLVLVPVLAHADLVTPPPRESRPSTAPARGTPGKPGIESVGGPETAPEGDIILGGGYNALTGDYLPGVCVQGNAPTKTFGFAELQGTFTRMFIDSVQDMQTNASASGTDAGFNVTYKLISLGASAGSSSESFFNSVDSFGRLYYRIAVKGELLRSEGWSGLGKTEIANPLKRFIQICGTHYVHAIYYGHQIDHTYKFELAKNATDKQSRDDVSFGVGKIFGFNYSDTEHRKTVDDKSSMSVDDGSRGLLPALPPTSSSASGVQELAKYAREDYRDAVLKADPSSARPILVELVSYANLPATGSDKIPEWPDKIRGEVSGRGGLYASFLTVLGDLERADKLPSIALSALYDDSAQQITDKLGNAIKVQTAYRKAVSDCIKLLDANTAPDDADTTCSGKLDAAMNPSVISSLRAKIK